MKISIQTKLNFWGRKFFNFFELSFFYLNFVVQISQQNG